jgi:glycosyltransferase involved in cell wall biosynthesis
VLVVTGIWPPDPGGPASHAPALSRFLHEHGHRVEVVTTADAPPAQEPYGVHWISRSRPAAVRHAAVALSIARRAAASDVVYATSMVRRAAIGSLLARKRLVVKLVSDEVFERMLRAGRFEGTPDAFQTVGGLRVHFLRATRNWALRRAAHVFCPSAYLRGIAMRWRLEPDRVTVLPNPAPTVPALPPKGELRADLDLDGRVLAFAGRLGRQKSLSVALEALSRVPEVTLAIAGDGPERPVLERRVRELRLDGRARFLGSVERDAVLRLFRAADASVLPSSWENLPHAVLESLAVGTPVIATAVGGVAEVVRDGENGLLVPPDDADALARAIQRFFSEAELRRGLAERARASIAHVSEESVFSEIEWALQRATAA